MWRYRLLYGLMMGVSFGLAQGAAPHLPTWKNPALLGVVLAYFAGIIVQKYEHKIRSDYQGKSFRLLKGVDKW